MNQHQDTKPALYAHDDIMDLLPWYVKDKLSSTDKTAVDQHLPDCELCRQELSACEALIGSLPEPNESWKPSATHFAGILASVNTLEAAHTPEKATLVAPKSSFIQHIKQLFAQTPRTVRWALITESFAVAIFAFFMVVPGHRLIDKTGSFVTLSTVESPPLTQGKLIRLILSADMTTRELADLLTKAKAQIRQGPSEVGSFTIEVRPDDEKPALSLLLAHPKVQLAQPIQ